MEKVDDFKTQFFILNSLMYTLETVIVIFKLLVELFSLKNADTKINKLQKVVKLR